ncbi:60S ribosomal protein L32 [Emergomyces africanus]|uniref:60S ribosomal protein L32 n=1 Tax=Emergomyces africanus TaxID=1955775 RepID=A0A1B7NY69_9EURO|nr:60S ribosomal protein L32 [Emergomyces africanus]
MCSQVSLSEPTSAGIALWLEKSKRATSLKSPARPQTFFDDNLSTTSFGTAQYRQDGRRKEACTDREETYVPPIYPGPFKYRIGLFVGYGSVMVVEVWTCGEGDNPARGKDKKNTGKKKGRYPCCGRNTKADVRDFGYTDKKRFNRHQSDTFKCVDASWRKPKGIDNRVRRRFSGQAAMPKIGYGSNKKTRHMTPSGHKVFLVQNPKDVELLLMHNRTYAAEIGHAVSSGKRINIIAKAKALGVKVTNPKGRLTTES